MSSCQSTCSASECSFCIAAAAAASTTTNGTTGLAANSSMRKSCSMGSECTYRKEPQQSKGGGDESLEMCQRQGQQASVAAVEKEGPPRIVPETHVTASSCSSSNVDENGLGSSGGSSSVAAGKKSRPGGLPLGPPPPVPLRKKERQRQEIDKSKVVTLNLDDKNRFTEEVTV